MAPPNEKKITTSTSAPAAVAPPTELMQQPASAMMKPGFELPEGFEESDLKRDLKLSRLVLLQPLTPEVIKEGAKYRPGEWMDSVTKTPIGQSFLFVPLKTFTQRIKWIPREQGGGRECIAQDGQHGSIIRTKPKEYGTCADCMHANWRPGKGKETFPLCSLYQCFLGFIPGDVGFPVVLALDRSKLKHGSAIYKTLLEESMKLADKSKRAMRSFTLRISSQLDHSKTENTDYWNLKWEMHGPSSEAALEHGAQLYSMFGKKTIEVDMEAPEGAPENPGGAEATPF